MGGLCYFCVYSQCMQDAVSKDMVSKWIRAWTLSRKLPPPLDFGSGFKVDVGYDKQKTRYVFPELNDDFIRLANCIKEPWVFLKVCALPADVKKSVPEKWKIQPQGYMMCCFKRMHIPDRSLQADYRLERDTDDPEISVVRVYTQEDELACIGRLVIVDDLAVYDRVLTDEKHRRKGLATVVMKELEQIALAKGISKNFLVATEEGRLLYEALGWKLYSVYTSIALND